MNLRSGRALAVAVALALSAGCGESPPNAPAPSPPPANVSSVTPAARATAVLYDSQIQVEFLPAINPATLDSTTVFMKLDVARYPIALRYDAATHVLHITPKFTVKLLRTYTIEITPRVLTTTGSPVVPGGYFWQFTTNTVRRPEPGAPANGVAMESPSVRLAWAATEPSAGTVNYDVYVSDDSVALAAGTVPRLSRVTRAYYIPVTRWGFDRQLFWSVNAINSTSGEALRGPIARFATLPASTPIDSVIVPLDRWGYLRRQTGVVTCSPGSMPSSGTGDFSGAMLWKFPASAQPWRLADASLELQSNTLNWLSRRPSVYFTRDLWTGCTSLSLTNPQPDPNGEMAVGGTGYGLDWVKFRSEYLTAYFEAWARYGDVGALQLYSVQLLSYGTSVPTDPYRGALRIYYYKLPASATSSTAP